MKKPKTTRRVAATEEERREKRRVRKRITSAAWKKRNPEKVNAGNARWRAANPEKVKAMDDSWRRRNPEKVRKARRESARRWLAVPENRAKDLLAQEVRRRKKGIPVRYFLKTEEERRERKLAGYRRNNDRRQAEGYFKQWRAKPEVRAQRIERTRSSYAADPQRYIAYQVKYAEKHPDRVAARLKRWRRANPDAVKASKRASNSRHPDRVLARIRRWQRANPDKVRLTRLKREYGAEAAPIIAEQLDLLNEIAAILKPKKTKTVKTKGTK